MQTPGVEKLMPVREMYEGKTVMITGANGFLGKHVAAKVAMAGADVIAVSSAYTDMRDQQSDWHERFNPDLLIHLAAKISGIVYNKKAPYDYLVDNTLIAMSAVRWAMQLKVPIVAAGSVCVYSDEVHLPFKEKDIFKGLPEESNLGYGLAKRTLLHLLMTASSARENFRYAYVNPANLYGPYDNFGLGGHVIPNLIEKCYDCAMNGTKTLRVLGSGKTTRDFLYVDDAADAFVLAGAHMLKGKLSMTINIGTAREISILTVLSMLCDEFGIHPQVETGPDSMNGQQRRLVDPSLAYALLGWRAKTDFREGLRNTVQWFLGEKEDKREESSELRTHP